MNYEKAEKRLSDMSEKEALSDYDYEFLNEIAHGDDMCLKCDTADLLIDHTTKQAVEILKMLSNDNDATVRASAYDNMWVFETQDFDGILRNAVANEKDGTARSYAIFSLYDLYSENGCDTAGLIDFMYKLYRTEKDRRCKLQYLRNFYLSGETDKLSEIIAYLEDEDYRMRITAVNTISEIRNKGNNDVLLSALKNRLKAENSEAVKASIKKFVNEVEEI
ncbi:MAG: HEAT repeat domain-containing protein [Ruminiclostridium sp.]|nr:HEAT repeat domain-containing protein [Ruminiclostridium sp.]